ncbi:GNAT family N-acetyltransferase [Hymenobacter rubripertinctus]|uniref:GNAT family N-acetyltransferase n=1 Tax=Hymenobacter rubripertinctus TaxID=2029981 RepID=A0A418QNH1_9BACT|nr:GNAT family N-acetyltransferase [Hymenobacter rubripertinctus]RIY06672.1 GNAT family N-acetyltransferase [Hymenobacter rubripertinctus]
MLIRPADRSDLHNVYLLWSELMDEHAPYHPIFGYHRMAQVESKQVLLNRMQEPCTRFFVAETPAGLAGLLIAIYQIGNNAMHYKRRGYIAETLVRPAFRGQGIGRELFLAAKSWLLAAGADHLELQVAVTNEGAQRFWAAMGFAPTTYHLVHPLVPPPAPDEWPS